MSPRLRPILALALLAFAGTGESSAADPFLVKPYLQLGDAPVSASGDLVVLWQTDDVDAGWAVESRSRIDGPWREAEAPSSRRIAVAGVAPHRVYRAALKGLAPG